MIEPTETESLETMDAFIQTMLALADEDPDVLHEAPHTRPISRLDETQAARKPVLVWPE